MLRPPRLDRALVTAGCVLTSLALAACSSESTAKPAPAAAPATTEETAAPALSAQEEGGEEPAPSTSEAAPDEEEAAPDLDTGALADKTVWVLHWNKFARRIELASLRLWGFTAVEEYTDKLYAGDERTLQRFERALRFHRACLDELGDAPYRTIRRLGEGEYFEMRRSWRLAHRGCAQYERGARALVSAFELRSNTLLREGNRAMQKGDRLIRRIGRY
jgi:hypothetical protein